MTATSSYQCWPADTNTGGHVDPCDLESLRDHVEALARDGDLPLVIDVNRNDE